MNVKYIMQTLEENLEEQDHGNQWKKISVKE